MERIRRGTHLRRDAGAGVVVVIGAMLLRLSLTNTYQRYVRVSSRPELIVAGVVLVALGVVDLVRSHRRPGGGGHAADDRAADDHAADDHAAAAGRSGAHPEHGSGHNHVPATAILLLAPIVAVFLVTPPSLGAYAAARSARVVRSQLQPPTYLPAPVNGAVDLTVSDFTDRASYGQDLTVGRYRLVGFVMPPGGTDQAAFLLTRMRIACCAADAQTAQVPVVGTADVPREGTWVEVVGSEVIGDTGVPQLQVFEMRRITSPPDPYE